MGVLVSTMQMIPHTCFQEPTVWKLQMCVKVRALQARVLLEMCVKKRAAKL